MGLTFETIKVNRVFENPEDLYMKPDPIHHLMAQGRRYL